MALDLEYRPFCAHFHISCINIVCLVVCSLHGHVFLNVQMGRLSSVDFTKSGMEALEARLVEAEKQANISR